MSMDNYPTVVLGKIFDRGDIPESTLDSLLDEEYDGIVAQSGESNFDRPCVGAILGQIGPHEDDNEIVLFDSPKAMQDAIERVMKSLVEIGLPVVESDIKLYMRDNWG